jgi:hypothetical protein
MKKFAVLILLLTLPGVHALGADFYVVNVAPKTVSPDETVLLNITLKNLGDEPAAFLRAILDPRDTSPINAVGPAKKYLSKADKATRSTEYFGVVSQGTEIFLQYPIHVDENATIGTYGVPLKLIWQNISVGESDQTIELGITVVGEPALVIAGVDTLPSRIYADSEFNLSVKVENIGTDKAEAVELTLGLPEEFTGERTGFLGTIKRDSTSTGTFNLKVDKNAASKAYDFTLKITYQNAYGASGTIEKGFEVYVGERGEIDVEIAGVTTSPSKIHPGEDFSLSVQLENIGKQDAKSVRAEITPLEEFVGERIAFVGSLKEDDLSTAIFEMSVSKDAEPKTYEIKMTVFYTDEKGIEYRDEKYFGIMVSEKPRNTWRTIAGGGLAALVIVGLYFWRKNKAKLE